MASEQQFDEWVHLLGSLHPMSLSTACGAEATVRRRYKVTNLYGCDYLVDQDSVIVLQANRPPSVSDMEGVARKFNRLDIAFEALRGVAIMLNTELSKYENEPWAQRVRAALHPQPEEGK